jgi:trehalose synthase-fused probable maltokinase
MLIEMKDNHVLSLISDPVCRLPLVRDILPQYLMARRWYASKEDITAPSVAIEAYVAVPDLADAIILLLGVKAKTGTTSSYFFPIRTVWECERPETGVVCELRAGPAGGWLVDGFSDDGFVRALLEGIRQAEGQSRTTGNSLAFYRSPIFHSEASFKQSEIGRSGAEQSNTSVIATDVILKAFRKLEPGIHPELEIGKYLTNKARLRSAPKLLGSIEYVCGSTGERTALCVLQSFIQGGQDGWKYVTRHLGLWRESACRDRAYQLVSLAKKIGDRTAELHQAFGTATDNPDFKPESVSQEWLSKWEHRLLASVSSASEGVVSRIPSFPDDDRALGNSFVARKAELSARIKETFPKSTKAMRTRLHGDFHLGQTIITKSDVFIVDFEGEPMRPLAERRGKYFPLRDVAGMLRSFEYASAAAARESELAESALSAIRAVTSQMQSGFLTAYAAAIAGCVSFPDDLGEANAVLELCFIEKALYEVHYEIANRPDRISIPIAGLLAVIDGNSYGFKCLV